MQNNHGDPPRWGRGGRIEQTFGRNQKPVYRQAISKSSAGQYEAITLASAARDPRMELAALRQRRAFVARIERPDDPRVQLNYAHATALFWREFRRCEADDIAGATRLSRVGGTR